MAILISSFIIFLAMIFAMAMGVLFGRPAIKGSCGGFAGGCPHAGRNRVDCMAGCKQVHELENTLPLPEKRSV